ncbi:hypothetical protein M752DRAFT_27859 [Aspergillus phoenicis ATCC 13157]|uniref:Uncharacterized protein n=1 Tax=Aspergillus phoenicis ATCC 13157 TaxID=1353007 RepID=A0A370PH56_ASPPH|nr:hypothetical protein M752DRAFT_27859 [Aspergillus phoenicis ATCC 13157]
MYAFDATTIIGFGVSEAFEQQFFVFPSVSVEVQMSAWLGYLVIIAPFCHRILLSPCYMQESRQFARLKGLWRH